MFSIDTFRQRWDLLLDKVNAPYFTDEEFEEFVNMGVLSYIDSHLTGIKANGEENDKIEENFSPLIEIVEVTSNDLGEVLDSDVDTSLGAESLYSYNVAVKSSCGDFKYCRFVRHNDYFKIIKNSWKKPSEEYPIYRRLNEKIIISPESSRKVIVTALKTPERVSLENGVDLLFDENTSMKILQISLQLAGYAVDDMELYQLASTEEQKIG